MNVKDAIGLAQMTTEMHFTPRWGAMRPIGFHAATDAGRYTLTGSGVIVRAQPSASSNELGMLALGDTVEVFGDPVEIDPAFMVGPNGVAVLNDGSSAGIEYVHVGTEKFGAGWVAADFLAKATTSAPAPKPMPTPAPSPTPSTPAEASTAKKSYVTPVLIGGLLGIAVLGTVALGIREYNKQRRHAHA